MGLNQYTTQEAVNKLAIDGFGSGSGAVGDGRKVVAAAATAETLASSTSCRAVVITALSTNSGTVVVGGSTVIAALATRRGTPLLAGESISLDISNLNLIYLDVTVSGEGVTYTYTT